MKKEELEQKWNDLLKINLKIQADEMGLKRIKQDWKGLGEQVKSLAQQISNETKELRRRLV